MRITLFGATGSSVKGLQSTAQQALDLERRFKCDQGSREYHSEDCRPPTPELSGALKPVTALLREPFGLMYHTVM